MVVLLSEQFAVLIQGPLGDFRQGFLKLLPRSLIPYRLQGAGNRLGSEDPLDGSCFKGLVPDGMFHRPMNILTLVMFLHP